MGKLEFSGFVKLCRAPSAQKLVSGYFHKMREFQGRVRNDNLELLHASFDFIPDLRCEEGKLWF